uniref:Uncharacterized protein n=1 Tax=Anguilla anguilla TaxID=7936 RepID=A0A0E9T317_ANGAN
MEPPALKLYFSLKVNGRVPQIGSQHWLVVKMEAGDCFGT